MKPITPQEFANCYGVFIADWKIALPKVKALRTWLTTQLPDVSTIYQLNASLFDTAVATINSFPAEPKPDNNNKFSKEYGRISQQRAIAYNKQVSLQWTAMTIDLQNALTCAEVDPALAAKILASFRNLKPFVGYK